MPAAPIGASAAGDVRLHIVTGKGGTGKTTVAGALALSLANSGRRVLLLEVEGRQGLAQLFGVPPLPYAEERIVSTDAGGEVWALAANAEDALLEYLDLFYKLGRAGRLLKKVGAVDFVTTIAPGLRDVLLTGKAYAATRPAGHGRDARRTTYDSVIVDAPPTGRVGRFLNVNEEVSGLAKVGPLRGQADSVMRLLRSPAAAVHVVTLLEEMPVQETIDAVAELRELGFPLGSVVVNAVQRPALTDAQLAQLTAGTVDAAQVRAALTRAGLPETAAEPLLAAGATYAVRADLQAVQRDRLADLGLPTSELPLLAHGVDRDSLGELATALDGGA